MNEGLLEYTLDGRVEAFTAGVNASLPYNVILGNQIHDIKVAVIKSKDAVLGYMQQHACDGSTKTVYEAC